MRYYIIAGEASGDLHGSNLMKGIYSEDPHADIRFWGGDCMNSVWSIFQNNPSHSFGAGPTPCGQGKCWKFILLIGSLFVTLFAIKKATKEE